MKSKINIFLPIILSLILPGLSFYSKPDVILPNHFGIIGNWVGASIFLYALWHLIWLSWRFQSKQQIGIRIGFFVMFIGLHMIFFFIFSMGDVESVKGYSFARILLGSLLFLTIQYALRTEQTFSRLQLEKEQVQTENYRVQLKALRTQVDPHFLFNSLNTLRSMVRQQHTNSEQFIMSLSDFYRQTLKHNENTNLKLSEELDVLKSYLFLMKSRNEEAVKIDIRIDHDYLSMQLPTLALQVVVENCFKHNSMTSRMPLYIEIETTKDCYINIKNNIQPKIGAKGDSGLGLELLRKRYELMKENNGILVEQTPETFTVKLKLI
ncbi:MAG: histidine kinase [Bacteroidota bacterium]